MESHDKSLKKHLKQLLKSEKDQIKTKQANIEKYRFYIQE